MSVDQVVMALGVSKMILHHQLKGGKSQSKAQEWRQALTRQEEKALAKWISISAATGNPVRYPFMLEMAEKLRETHVASASKFTPPLGSEWVKQFLSRHPHLKMKKSKAIETAHIKEVTSEQVHNFNTELRRIIEEHNIQLENIFNADETSIPQYVIINFRFLNWHSKWCTSCR